MSITPSVALGAGQATTSVTVIPNCSGLYPCAHKKLQGTLFSAAFSLSHGSNDAQKTAGLITGVLFTSHMISAFEVPKWVLLASYTAIAMGTFSGGWRIVRTMGARLTRLKPRSGFCAETGAAGAVLT